MSYLSDPGASLLYFAAYKKAVRTVLNVSHVSLWSLSSNQAADNLSLPLGSKRRH